MYYRILLWSIYLIGAIGIFIFGTTSLYNGYFELLFLALAVPALRSISKECGLYFFLILSYLAFSVLYSVVLQQDNILDFLLIYKFFYYAVFLLFLPNKGFINEHLLVQLSKVLIWIFFIKYIIAFFVFGDDRPTLWHENNYELMLLVLLFYMSFIIKGSSNYWEQAIMAIIFLLSGSKSALLILILVLFAVNYKFLIKRIHIILPFGMLFIILTYEIFKSRMGGEINLVNVDRYKFFMFFLNEIEHWSFVNYIFGAERITELSEETCMGLGYYKTLFSYSGNGSCYSVIFHSYIMRAIFDHGILIFAGMLLMVYRLMKLSGISSKDSWVMIGIVLINGLSVSSFNSIYFALPFALILLTYYDKRMSTENIAI